MWMRYAERFGCVETIRKPYKYPWILMSLFFYSNDPHLKGKSAPLQETRMRDRFTLYAKGGDGGNGCFSIRRSRHDRRGRPDGGNGGRGGDVILECSSVVWDFRGLQHHANALKGGHGAAKNMIGTRGEDKVVQVPVGTVIHLLKGEIPSKVDKSSSKELDPWDLPGSLNSELLKPHQPSVSKTSYRVVDVDSLGSLVGSSAQREDKMKEITCSQAVQAGSEDVESIQYNVAELTEPGEQLIVAYGGDGGFGSVSSGNVSRKPKPTLQGVNNDFSLTPELTTESHSSPSMGMPGSEAVLILELKSIADVGLVGMPNAGKSTLLGAISRAKPRVGHYAFTTLRPNLGKLSFHDFSITVADIPGLIKGAHEDRGLGHAFLRHIERTKVLAYVVDLAAALDGRKGLPPWMQLKDLVLELEHHQQGLSDRPSLIVANKIDEAGAEEVYKELKRRVQHVPIYPVCAVLEEGVQELKDGLRMLVDSRKSQRLNLDEIDCS